MKKCEHGKWNCSLTQARGGEWIECHVVCLHCGESAINSRVEFGNDGDTVKVTPNWEDEEPQWSEG
jgi:hypothetical protein